MTRRRDQKAAAHLQGILHQITQAKGKPSPELLQQIKQSAMDARDVLLIQDPDEQRFWAAVIVFGQSAQSYTRKVFGRTVERVKIVDDEGYHWSAATILRLAPSMMLRAA